MEAEITNQGCESARLRTNLTKNEQRNLRCSQIRRIKALLNPFIKPRPKLKPKTFIKF